MQLAEHIISHCPHLKFTGLMTIGQMNYDWGQGENPDFIVSTVVQCLFSIQGPVSASSCFVSLDRELLRQGT